MIEVQRKTGLTGVCHRICAIVMAIIADSVQVVSETFVLLNPGLKFEPNPDSNKG